MRVLDLFSGIGGFSLGLERAGMTTVAFCEIDPYCRAVLRKHWPDVPCYDDIRTLNRERLAADGIAVDVICGGFPCQDISCAGAGAGIDGERSGLWREYSRLIGELRPRYAIVENVAALLGRGLDVVLGDLAALGLDAEWHCIPASAVGAPHRRDRIWIVAYPRGEQHEGDRAAIGRPRTAGLPEAAVAHANGSWPAQSARSKRKGGVGLIQRGEALADTARDGRKPRRPRDAAQGAGRRQSGRGAIGADLRHPNGTRLAIWKGIRRDDGEEQPAAVGTDWWLSEPDVGGTLDGFSSWLDGFDLTQSHELLFTYGNATKNRPGQTLRSLRREIGAPDVQRTAGGSGGIPAASVLLAYLRKLEEGQADQARLQLAGAQASEGGVRSMRASEKPASAPHRPKRGQQRSAEHPDTVQTLSRFLARHAEAAWSAYRRQNAPALLKSWSVGWEDGFARVAHGVPSRVDRLGALGNAVVPQIPEIIGRAIMESRP